MGRHSTKDNLGRLDLMQGTLDMLILKTLRLGRRHGQAIAREIEQTSQDLLKVDHGSLYPALQRLQQEGWIEAEWGVSTNNRKAKFYTLTRAGRRQLHAEESRWRQLTRAIALIMSPEKQS
jgi:transcriptional regulator